MKTRCEMVEIGREVTRGGQKAIPNFFTTIVVNLLVESKLSRVTSREIWKTHRGANVIVPREGNNHLLLGAPRRPPYA